MPAKTLNNIYNILVLFKTGLELDGMVNQNFNSTLEMFRYSLTSTSVTLSQYMNILRFLAQHIKELINEYFIRVYDETINTVMPQIFDEGKETLVRESEKFYREIFSSAFLVQEPDHFIAGSLNMINNMLENYSEAHIHNMMTYNPDLAISPMSRDMVKMDNQVFLGAKAYYLKKLISYGLPIPPGFVLTTEVYRHKETIFEHPYMSYELEKLIVKYLNALPDDIQMIFACDGLVTSRGGVTSHAAVAAEKLGKVCIVNCRDLTVDDHNKQCKINGFMIKAGDPLSIDGSVGSIYAGSYPIKYAE